MLCCRQSGSDSDDDKSFQGKNNVAFTDHATKDSTDQEGIKLQEQDANSRQDSPVQNNQGHEGPPKGEQISEGPVKETQDQQVVEAEDTPTKEEEMASEALSSCVGRLEAVASRLEELAKAGSVGSSRSSSGEPEVLSAAVIAYSDAVDGLCAKFLELCTKIGGDVKTMGGKVESAFGACKSFIVMASKSKKPSDGDLPKLLKPLQDAIGQVQAFREGNRVSPLFNHLSAVSEAIGALGWVVVAPTPGPYVKEMQDAGMFYTNRVLKDWKEKDQTHVEWTKSWNAIFTTLQAYIKAHHTTGLTWNPQGGIASVPGAPAAAAGGAPPPPPPGPPPPPPPPSVAESAAPSGGGDDSRAALLDALNQGTDITKGLKKVTDDMKTHKNPALRQKSSESARNDGLKKVTDDMKTHKNPTLRQGPAPFKAAAPSAPKIAPKVAPKPGSQQPVQKPPVFELMEKKWVIENQVNNHQLVVEETNIKQAVYAFKCTNSTITIKGKINTITLDNCKKVAIVFDDILSSLEFINCQSVQGQVMGRVPTISIDKTDGCMIYLSKDSLDTSVVTAKSSEMNILIPKGDGDYTEFAVPEQFKTTWDGKKLVTVMADVQ